MFLVLGSVVTIFTRWLLSCFNNEIGFVLMLSILHVQQFDFCKFKNFDLYKMTQWKELSEKRSDVWNHFLVNIHNDSLVKCKYCFAKFNLNNCSTSPLIYHLEKKWKIKLKGKADDDNFQSHYKSKQMTIQVCFQKKDSPELVLATLAALDLLPFYKFEKSRNL